MKPFGSIFKQAQRPTGWLGRIIGLRMNTHHERLWHWALDSLSIPREACILDIGCGGGRAIGILAAKASKGKVVGIDHSNEMLKTSEKINKLYISENRVALRLATVSALPFAAGRFDLATAFETSYFWPDIAKDLEEIWRVLKSGGTILLANMAYRHNNFLKRNAFLSNIAGLKLHSVDEYYHLLGRSGFANIRIVEDVEKNWIKIVAQKPSSTCSGL